VANQEIAAAFASEAGPSFVHIVKRAAIAELSHPLDAAFGVVKSTIRSVHKLYTDLIGINYTIMDS
jgi:hypothetical protein